MKKINKRIQKIYGLQSLAISAVVCSVSLSAGLLAGSVLVPVGLYLLTTKKIVFRFV